MSGDIIVLLIIATIVIAAIAKIVIDKKNGVQCAGCPAGKTCSSKSACSSNQPLFGSVNSEDKQD